MVNTMTKKVKKVHKKNFSGCRMCGFVPATNYGSMDWLAHRLENFKTHYPWMASRFVVKL